MAYVVLIAAASILISLMIGPVGGLITDALVGTAFYAAQQAMKDR